jgi:hypothetical protein
LNVSEQEKRMIRTKEERRLAMERAAQIAAEDLNKRLEVNREKTERLRALRLASKGD